MTPKVTPGWEGLDLEAVNIAEHGRESRAVIEILIAEIRRMRSQVSGGEGAPADLRERLAALCHEQWSGWMKYLFGKCEILPNAELGDLAVIPEWAVQRWKRQMETPYASLSEKEKDSDRAEADWFLALLPAPAVPDALTLVLEQAEDEGLWLQARTATEAYLQQALRRLHAVIERRQPDALTWTREKPTEMGLYLARDIGDANPSRWFVFRVEFPEHYIDVPHQEIAGPIPSPREAPPAAPSNEGEAK